MVPLIPTTCPKCKARAEAKLSFAGPHIKRSCRECGAYIDFYTKALIPDALDIKYKIWALTDENLTWINNVKEEIDFPKNIDTMSGLPKKMLYWRLYSRILDQIKANGVPQ